MPSIDERIVSMAFENQVFEQRVAQTMGTLSKLDTAIRNMGKVSGLEDIEKAANKVTLQGPMSALDKLKAKLGTAGAGAAEGLGEIDRAGNKVTLEGPSSALDKLKAKMGLLNTGSTFTDIERDADRVTLSGLHKALDGVTAKFSVLQGAAAVALGNIQAQALSRAGAFVKSFTFAPILDGLHEYQTNLQAIQTVQANTDQPLPKINNALNQLNKYSDQTIYNFGEMAKNVGTFTAAGVDLKTSVSSIKGIANMAALSGSNSQQAATAMYQLSQAISSGRVGLQDWNSVVNAGMGGKKLQNALAQTAVAMGGLEKGAVKMEGPMKKLTINGESFRESIMTVGGAPSWLKSDVLVNTLATLDGRFSRAALSAEKTSDGLQKYSKAEIEAKIQANRHALELKNGVKYTDAQFESLMKLSDSAFKSATEVKTLGQVFDIAKETIGSGWSASFVSIFGNLKEAKTLFTGMSNTINGFINANAMARNQVLHDWKAMGGRTELIDGLKQAFQDVIGIIKPIKDAFRDIFPRKTGQDLFEMTKNFHALMEGLKPSPELIDNLRRIFGGLFAVVHIGWNIIKNLVGVIADLLGVVGKGSGGFLGFVAGIGDFLKAADVALTKGGLLKGIFEGIGEVLKVPIRLIGSLVGAIAGLFGAGDADKAKGVADSLGQVGQNLGPLKSFVDAVATAWKKFVGILDQVKTALDPWFSQMADKLSGVGDILADAFKNLDFEKVMSGLQTGFIAGIFVVLKKALGGGGGGGGLAAILNPLKDTLGGVNGVLGEFSKTLEGMQSKLHAEALAAIGAAVALLAAGIFILSQIDGDKLSKAMTAVAVGLGEMVTAAKLLTMGGKGKGLGGAQFAIMAAGMIALAVSVTILAGAMKIFATMSWEDIAKGLAGVAGSLVAVGGAMRLMPPTMPLTAAGLILVGVALNVIAAAMKQFGSMKLEEIAKGIFAMVEALAGIALGVSMMPPTLPLTAAGLVIMGVGLAAVGGAIRTMGSMDFLTIIKGLGTMMAAIAGIGLAISLVPPTIGLTAVGLLLVGQAMVVTAGAIALLGSLSVGTLVKGIVGLAGALIVLAGGLTLMIVSLPGALALTVAAGALAVLVPVLGLLGNMKWSTIFKGLGAIAAALVTIGVAGLVAAPAMAAIGIALLPLGLGFLLVAKAVQIFASGIALLSSSGQKGFAVFMTALTAFVALVPNLVLSFIKGLLDIASQIAVLAPKIVTALGVIIDTIIAFVIENAPKLAIAIGVLVDSILQVLLRNTPKLIAAGAKLLMDILNGISQNIGQIVTKVTEIITKFMNTLAAKAPQLVGSGAKLLVAFLQGITNNIPKVVTTVANMVVKFIDALSRNINRIVTAGQNMMLKFIGAIASFVPRMIQEGLRIIANFLSGISQNISQITRKGADLIIKFIEGITSNMNRVANKGADAVIKFLNALADTIRNKGPQIIQAGLNIADALIDGVTKGFGLKGNLIKKALDAVFQLIPGWAKKILGIHSPSTVFMEIGQQTMAGMAQGLGNPATKNTIMSTTSMMARSVPDIFRRVLGIHSPSEVMKQIGKQVTEGFSQGLRGSVSDINSAFHDMNDKLVEQINTSNQTIADKKGELNDLLKSKDADPQAIIAARQAIADETKVLNASRAARQTLIKGLAGEHAQLNQLTTKYEDVSAKLEKASQVLDEAKQKRDEAEKNYAEKYGATPEIGEDAGVADYKKSLQDRINATKSFASTMQQLRKLGLDDTTYRKLLEQGLDAKPFAEKLLAGGKAAVTQVNALDTQLQKVAAKMARQAARNLYQTGVDAAQGLVNGLRSRQGALKNAMNDLADDIVATVKRKLKIRSPSEVMADVGTNAVKGFAAGVLRSAPLATNAAEDMGNQMVSTAQRSVRGLGSMYMSMGDIQPVITPVVDLTHVDKAKQLISSMGGISPLTTDVSLFQAQRIAQDKAASDTDVATAAGPTTQITYEQNNYSPDPISNIELYRQTNNQLAKMKSLVGVT